MNSKTLCHHTLVELEGCDPESLKRVPSVREAMLEAVRAGGGTIVESVFHAFSPWGVSGVVVITESHVTIHTWPEHGYAAVDILSCSPKLDHGAIAKRLASMFGAANVGQKGLKRGPAVSREDITTKARRHKGEEKTERGKNILDRMNGMGRIKEGKMRAGTRSR